jgi:hypothetical protein
MNYPAAEQPGIFKGNETPQAAGNYPSSASGGLKTKLLAKQFFDKFIKIHKLDGTVKSARCKARESLGLRRTVNTVGMTKDIAQHPDGLNRETFYEAVNFFT